MGTTYDEQSIYEEAIKKFGAISQMNMAIEEMSELTKEILKYQRGYMNRENIIEELADVYITLKQVEIIFRIAARELQKEQNRKLGRLAKRLIDLEIME